MSFRPALYPAAATLHDEGTYPVLDSMRDFPVRHGRTYHAYHVGCYKFPNDAREQERLRWQFEIIRRANSGTLYWAPIPALSRQVLDIGTGTGSWCIALAESGQVPYARITGIDLSPIQPETVPPNVFFEVEDCTDEEWARPHDSTDFIHCQFLMGALQDYEALIAKARSYLVPGSGWLECRELDFMYV